MASFKVTPERMELVLRASHPAIHVLATHVHPPALVAKSKAILCRVLSLALKNQPLLPVELFEVEGSTISPQVYTSYLKVYAMGRILIKTIFKGVDDLNADREIPFLVHLFCWPFYNREMPWLCFLNPDKSESLFSAQHTISSYFAFHQIYSATFQGDIKFAKIQQQANQVADFFEEFQNGWAREEGQDEPGARVAIRMLGESARNKFERWSAEVPQIRYNLAYPEWCVRLSKLSVQQREGVFIWKAVEQKTVAAEIFEKAVCAEALPKDKCTYYTILAWTWCRIVIISYQWSEADMKQPFGVFVNNFIDQALLMPNFVLVFEKHVPINARVRNSSPAAKDGAAAGVVFAPQLRAFSHELQLVDQAAPEEGRKGIIRGFSLSFVYRAAWTCLAMGRGKHNPMWPQSIKGAYDYGALREHIIYKTPDQV